MSDNAKDIKQTSRDRSKAYAIAERRIRQNHQQEFNDILREELAKFGLEPVADKRRAKAEADLARIREQFPELIDPSADAQVAERPAASPTF